MSDRAGWGSDAPWWYNERASLSHLAGAVWQSNGWVTEEFVVNPKERGGPAESRRGRCDLMFEVDDLRVVAEAKQVWPRITSRRRDAAALQRGLSAAWSDVRRRPVVEGYHRYGVIFAVPFATRRLVADSERLHVRLTEFVRAAHDLGTPAAIAWAFPTATRTLRSPRYPDRYFPGVVLAVARCPRPETEQGWRNWGTGGPGR
jgi:hypothetical protein